MALSWLNLPCALKAAIGIGKRTFGHRCQSGVPQGGAARASAYRPSPIANASFVASPGGGRRISTRASGRFHFPPGPIEVSRPQKRATASRMAQTNAAVLASNINWNLWGFASIQALIRSMGVLHATRPLYSAEYNAGWGVAYYTLG